jgi:hypothetical protein
MRTGPFSSTQVIELLNASFVPVYAVNEDYRARGAVPREEQAEYLRIYREALAKKFSAGTVHVYVLNPRGEVIGTRHVADAARTRELLAFLRKVAAQLGTRPGKPLVKAKAQSRPPEHPKGALVLHLAARGLGGGGSWDGTAENWVVYTPGEAKKLVPAGAAQPVPKKGTTWEIDPKLAARLLVHVYPVTENNDPAKNAIRKQALRGKVIEVKGALPWPGWTAGSSCAMTSITSRTATWSRPGCSGTSNSSRPGEGSGRCGSSPTGRPTAGANSAPPCAPNERPCSLQNHISAHSGKGPSWSSAE